MLTVETNCYMDERTLVLGQTLIRLKCGEACVTVPAAFGGFGVTTLGSGALTLDGVQELTIAPGYAELKEKCVSAASTLKRVNIPESVQTVPESMFASTGSGVELYVSRGLKPALFLDIRRMSLPVGGTDRLLPSDLLARGGLEIVRRLMGSVEKPAAEINRGMRLLFCGRLPDGANRIYNGTVFDPRPCYDFLSGRRETEEYTAVMEMISDEDPGWHHPASERASDRALRAGHDPLAPVLYAGVGAAVCERMPFSPGPDGLFHVLFRLFRKNLFFPTLRQVRHRGADWWIYSRNWLTVSPEHPYQREDVGVFDRNGLVTDRKVSEDVYAKARFLSLL